MIKARDGSFIDGHSGARKRDGGRGLRGRAYRLFANQAVSPEKILAPHVGGTVARMRAAGDCLVVHDTSTFSFRPDGQRKGLGRLKTAGQGFFGHVSLALTDDGTRTPLGVLDISASPKTQTGPSLIDVNLSGRGTGYRGMAIRCPGCAEPMVPELVGDAEVDVCASCGGIWIDWFDGEIRKVATSVVRGEARRASEPPPVSALRSESVATGACPRCLRQLAVERYVVRVDVGPTDAPRTSVSQTTGADLLRCEECAGVFVARPSAALLATLPPDDPPPPSSTDGSVSLEPLPWQRFMAVLKGWLGL